MGQFDIKSMGRMLRHLDDPNAKRLFESMLSNIDTLNERIKELENPNEISWINFKLLSSWTQITSGEFVLPQYFKTKEGFVNIRGVISSGTVTDGTVIANLPMGFRPKRIAVFSIVEDSGTAKNSMLVIYPDGDVAIENIGNNAKLSIACTFLAEI